MLFADLTDTDFEFSCELDEEDVDYSDYAFKASINGDNYYRSMNRIELEVLRNNCKRILESTETFLGGSWDGL